MSFDILPWLLVLAALGGVWWNALGARTRARRAAMRACREAKVRYIDELRLARIRIARGGRGRLTLEREYAFEFYHRGDIRYRASVAMHGLHVARVELGPHPLT